VLQALVLAGSVAGSAAARPPAKPRAVSVLMLQKATLYATEPGALPTAYEKLTLR